LGRELEGRAFLAGDGVTAADTMVLLVRSYFCEGFMCWEEGEFRDLLMSFEFLVKVKRGGCGCADLLKGRRVEEYRAVD
jgi:hypothetical protein